jgi:DNA-binding CsgD family transcriptional regulator
MARTETQLLKLALSAYEAASQPELWPDFLKRYMEAVSADMVILQVHDFKNQSSNILFGHGINSRFQNSYNDHFAKLNLWRRNGRARYSSGRINLAEELCPTALLEKSEFYNDFLRPLNGVYCMGAVIAVQGNCAPTLTSNRGREKPRFGEEERSVAQFLLPHLQRAWTVYQRLQLLSAGETAMDAVSLGIVFAAGDGTAIYCNRAAEEMLRAGDGLKLQGGALCSSSRKNNEELREMLHHAVSPNAVPGPKIVLIERPSLRRPYQLAAAPLRDRFNQFIGTPAPMAVVLISDPDRNPSANTDILAQVYKLTPKEAEMTARLSTGKSVEEAAEEMGITYETARTHLRRIFGKTGTSRQSELLLLIAKLPPGGSVDG